MKLRALLAFLTAAVLAALIWALSPALSGYPEPWDAEWFFYPAGLIFGGLISGVLVPRPLWAHYLGAVVGQLIYGLLFIKLGPLFVVGIGFLLVYSVLFVLSAGATSYVRLGYGNVDKGPQS